MSNGRPRGRRPIGNTVVAAVVHGVVGDDFGAVAHVVVLRSWRQAEVASVDLQGENHF